MNRQNMSAIQQWHLDEMKADLQGRFGEHYHTEDVVNYLSARIAKLEADNERLIEHMNKVQQRNDRKFNTVQHFFQMISKDLGTLDAKIKALAEMFRIWPR